MRDRIICLLGSVFVGFIAPTSVYAQIDTTSIIPRSAFFTGLGGSLNSADFGNQSIYAVGTSDVYQGNTLIATGTAGGPPVNVHMDTKISLSPSVQAGYFSHFGESNWLWGLKFAYNYQDATSTTQLVRIPQFGSFTSTGTNITTPFTGNAIVGTSETTIVQQISFIPIVGQSFGNGYVYAGAGLTYSQLRANQIQLVGFADINGNRQNISGVPQDFYGSGWAFGGAATAGVTYFFNSSWFLDLSYAFGATPTRKFNYSSSYTNPNGSNGTTTSGTLVGYASYNLITQAATLTINRAF